MAIVGDSAGPIGYKKGVALNVLGDTTINIEASKYIVRRIVFTNASVVPVLAQAAIRTAAGGAGSAIVAAAVLTGLTAPAIFNDRTLASPATTSVLSGDLYVNATVANAAAGTYDVLVYGEVVV